MQSTWSKDWEVAVRVWIERRGETVLGEPAADLLLAIDKTRSISAAARTLGISYRHAWNMVQTVNAAAGEALVEAAVGGLKGGGAQLTVRGKSSLDIFEQLRVMVRETAAGLLQKTNLDLTATLHLAAATSLQEVVGQLLTEYALRQPGVRVRAVYGASNELADHVLAGAPCDLFLSADPLHLDRLSGKIVTSSRTLVATNSLAVIAADRESTIRKPGDLPRAKKIVLSEPESPLGKCSLSYLEHHDLRDRLSAQIVFVDSARSVLAAIRSLKAEVGLAFASDAAKASGCRVLFEIDPAEASIGYYAAVCRGQRKQDSLALLEFFTTPAAQRCFRRCGLTLPHPQVAK